MPADTVSGINTNLKVISTAITNIVQKTVIFLCLFSDHRLERAIVAKYSRMRNIGIVGELADGACEVLCRFKVFFASVAK